MSSMTSAPFAPTVETNPAARTDAERQAILASPGFGNHFTDHMFLAEWTPEQGWHDARVVPYGPLQLDPAPACQHSAPEIFEGLQAYAWADGSVRVFRAEENAARLQRSARRLALPELPQEWFLGSIEALVGADRAWVPEGGETSLYLRPFMFASEAFLGVRPSQHVTYCVIASPAGAYFPGGVKPVSIWLSTQYSRAGAGGTGAAKCGGNYAGSMVASLEAQKKGFHNVLWLDGMEHKYVEEAGLMNVVFVINGTVVTPPLGGTILPGITRDSVLTLLRDMKVPVEERRISIDEVFDAQAKGVLDGAAGVGTAAVIAPLGRLRYQDREITVKAMTPDSILATVGAELEGIRSGRIADRHGWLMTI